MLSSLDERLRLAIAERRLIQVRYNGTQRVAEPHDYGVQKGVTRLLVYQLRAAGGDPRKSPRGWRMLDIAKVEACDVLDEPFKGSRGPAHERHYVWDVIYARVS
jgi:hypothetical protein